MNDHDVLSDISGINTDLVSGIDIDIMAEIDHDEKVTAAADREERRCPKRLELKTPHHARESYSTIMRSYWRGAVTTVEMRDITDAYQTLIRLFEAEARYQDQFEKKTTNQVDIT